MIAEEFSITPDDDTLEIVLKMGKFEARAVEAFNEAVEQQWTKGIHSAIIDMKAVEFIDSSGVGALLALRKRLPVDSPDITLVRPQKGILSVLEMLRLHRIFRIEEA